MHESIPATDYYLMPAFNHPAQILKSKQGPDLIRPAAALEGQSDWGLYFGSFGQLLTEEEEEEDLEQSYNFRATTLALSLIDLLASTPVKKQKSHLQDLGEHLEVRLAVPVGKVARRQLHQRDPQAPDVGADVVVGLGGVRRVDPLGGHVGGASGGPGLGLEEAHTLTV